MKVKTLTQSKPKYKMKGRTKARTKAISMILILSLCLASVLQPLSTSAGELGTSSTQMETEAGAFLHTFVFQNLDGTRTMYVMDEDVKYINTNGETIDKDISLVSKTKRFGIVQNEVELLIPNSVQNGIDVAYNGYAIKLHLRDLLQEQVQNKRM